jgi:hypothetical protein
MRYSESDSTFRNEIEAALVSLFTTPATGLSAAILYDSKEYIEYLYVKSKFELVYQFNKKFVLKDLYATEEFSFKDLYDKIKKDYDGVIREKLLAYHCVDYADLCLFFQGSDADEFTYCLRDAVSVIQNPYLRNSVAKQLKTMGKGADAFNFSLPDSSGKIISLSDFRGKIVFIDLWHNPCTGCKVFNLEFDKKVYPFIKDNPEVVIISISMNLTKSKWLDGVVKYSRPEFVNLYTAGLGDQHPFIKHYNVLAIPIDRNGKIISATVPFTGKGEDLLALINNSLEAR